MFNILLVNAPVSVNAPRTSFLPLPLLVLGGCLKGLKGAKTEFDYQIVDLDFLLKKGDLEDSPDFYRQASEFILKKTPDACLFTVHGPNLSPVLQIALKLKLKRPECFVVLGGVAPTLQAETIIRHFPQVDMVIKGEGEPALPEFIRTVLSDRDFSKVPSAVFRIKDKVIDNPRIYASKEGGFPFPDYSLINSEEYLAHNQHHPYLAPDIALVESGRGCYYCCVFCAPAKMWNRKVRYRPISDIIKEMRFLKSRGFNFIFFTQDNLDEKFLKELSLKLLEENVKISWGCYARLDPILKETGLLMARSGCSLIFSGLETPNPKSQKFIGKTLNRHKTITKMRYFNSVGIKFIDSLIAGFPGESADELNNTLSYALEGSSALTMAQLKENLRGIHPEEIPSTSTNFCMVHPLSSMPGTDFAEKFSGDLRLTEFPFHHDSYGSYIFGLDSFIRKNWRLIFNPFVTYLSEDKVRFYYSILRVFNFAIGSPYHFAWLVINRNLTPLDLTQEIVEKLNQDYVLRSNILDFDKVLVGVLNSYLGTPFKWHVGRY